MRAVLLRVRSALRRRWPSALVIAATVAVVTGVVFALAAGARRTADAPDAFTAAVGGDPDAYVVQPSGTPRTAEVAALPGVVSVDAMTFVFAGVRHPESGPALDTISFAGSRPSTSRLVAGRDLAARDEFVADEQFADQYGARLGDSWRLVSWTQEEADRGEYVSQAAGEGPSFEVRLVGIVDSADVLETEYSIALFSPALLDEDVGVATTNMNVRLAPGVTYRDLRAEVDGLPGGATIIVSPARVVSTEVRNAVGAQAQGIALMAVTTAVAAVIALGLVLTRHVRIGTAERDHLSALGVTRGQVVAEGLARAAIPAIAGIVVGAALAVAGSGRFPTGFVRRIEPHPGPRLDGLVLAAGGALLLSGMLGWVAAALLMVGSRRTTRSASVTTDKIARSAPTPAAATGVRFALGSREGSAATAVGSFVALAVLVGGAVGAAVFATSLDRLVTDRSRFGGNYDFTVGAESSFSATELRDAFEDHPDVAGVMILTSGTARTGATTVGLVGVEHVRGDLAPRVLAGRLPQGPDEVAFGRVAARELDVGVGDVLDLQGPGDPASYRIVGLAVVPTIGGNDGVGQGGVLTDAGLRRIGPDSPANLTPSGWTTMTMAAIVVAPDAAPGAGERLAALMGEDQMPGLEDVPSSILNVARVRGIPDLLALVLVAIATVALVHTLLGSIQRRGRDLAVLRALGADRSWIANAVRWQATVVATLAVGPGAAVGLIAGSFVFRAFAERIGAVSDPRISATVLVGAAIGFVVVANLTAVVVLRRVGRLSWSSRLRAE